MGARSLAVAALSTVAGIAVVQAPDAWSALFVDPPAAPLAPRIPEGFREASFARVLSTAQGPVVLLSVGRGELLPIWVGPTEGLAIERGARGQRGPRPMTHDLLGGVVTALDARVHHVQVRSLTEDGTYLGTLVLEGPDGARSVDARPSDAIAVALRAGAPIYVARSLEPYFLRGP